MIHPRISVGNPTKQLLCTSCGHTIPPSVSLRKESSMNVCKLMLSLLLVTASAVPLQTGSQSVASSKIDPGKEADIRRLLKLTGAEALVLQTMDGMEKDLKPLVKNSLPAGEYRDKLVDLFFARFQSKAKPGQMLDLAVPIYDSHFSAEEIKGLIQFYQTP
ncbi:MAG TPA: DUF2059 domain-containing protein, partial [Candidatus Angelobacter sp.]